MNKPNVVKPSLCPVCGAFIRLNWDTNCANCGEAFPPAPTGNKARKDALRTAPKMDAHGRPLMPTAPSHPADVGAVIVLCVLLVGAVLATVFILVNRADQNSAKARAILKAEAPIYNSVANTPVQSNVTLVTPTGNGWVHLTGPGGAFTVDLPATPVATTTTLDNGSTFQLWMSPAQDSTWKGGIGQVQLQQKVDGKDIDNRLSQIETLTKTAAGVSADMKETVTLGTDNGRRSLNANFAGSNTSVQERVFIDNKTVYVVVVDSTTAFGYPGALNELADSFTATIEN